MGVYVYEGKTRSGESRSGEVEALNEAEATAKLRALRVIPTKITVKRKGLFESLTFGEKKITHKDIVIFTRQFSTMIDAGLPLVKGLDVISKQQEKKSLKDMLTNIKEDVEQGNTLSGALKKYPKYFDQLYVSMVDAGEVGGILDVICGRLAVYMEKAMKLKKKVKGAMVYPAVVICVAIIVVAIILIFVIPVFQGMFADFGQALPIPTQIVINLSNFFKNNILYIIGAGFLIGYALKKAFKTEKGKKILDTYSLKTPIFGQLLKKVAVARFTRTMSTMLSSGVPILDALGIVSRTSGNTVIESALIKTRSEIASGKPVAETLAETGVFPTMVTQMIGVGEATGELDSMLGKIADFYDEEVDAAVEALTSMLEPILMVFLGGIIGGLVIAMYLPIFKMAGAVAGN